jgi:hypothetical protein
MGNNIHACSQHHEMDQNILYMDHIAEHVMNDETMHCSNLPEGSSSQISRKRVFK